MLDKFEIITNPYQHLRELQFDERLAVGVSFEHVQNDELVNRQNIFCFESPNHIYSYSMNVLTSKDFPYLAELNRFIKMASESGLVVKWLKGYTFGSVPEKKSSSEYVEVKLEMYVYLVLIALSLQILACLIAIIESTAFKKIHMDNARPFWRIIEMTVNPYRYFLMGDFFDTETN